MDKEEERCIMEPKQSSSKVLSRIQSPQHIWLGDINTKNKKAVNSQQTLLSVMSFLSLKSSFPEIPELQILIRYVINLIHMRKVTCVHKYLLD